MKMRVSIDIRTYASKLYLSAPLEPVLVLREHLRGETKERTNVTDSSKNGNQV